MIEFLIIFCVLNLLCTFISFIYSQDKIEVLHELNTYLETKLRNTENTVNDIYVVSKKTVIGEQILYLMKKLNLVYNYFDFVIESGQELKLVKKRRTK